MHNIKEIRKDFDAFSKALKKRSIDIDLNKLKKLDINQRCLGFFFMGSYDHKESSKSRDNLEDKVEWV